MRALLIVNPAAGGRTTPQRIAAVRSALRHGGWTTEVAPTERPGHATALAKAAVARGLVAVFALGGDGTLRETAAGLLGSEVPLGVLPGGTTNVLARALGVPLRLETAAAALAARHCVSARFDVGRCAGQPFLLMASCGLDSRALYRLSTVQKRRWGRAAMLWQAIQEWRLPPTPVAWSIETTSGPRTQRQSVFLACCNIAQYAGPFRLAPTAEWDDGRFEIVSHDPISRMSMLLFAFRVVCGLGSRNPSSEPTLSASERLMLSAPRELIVQVDGDALFCSAPVEITLAEQSIFVLLPRARVAEGTPLFSPETAGEATA